MVRISASARDARVSAPKWTGFEDQVVPFLLVA